MATSITERPYLYSFSENEIRYVFNVTDPATPGCEVEVELNYRAIGGVTATLVTFPLVPNPDGKVYCPVEDYLKGIVKPQIHDGSPSDFIQLANDQVKEFYIRFRQVTTAAPDPAWSDDVSNWRKVILGGVEKMKFKRNNYFVNYLTTNKNWLTWQPSKRFVYPDQKHYLSYLHTGTSSTTLILDITTYFTDGSNHNFQYGYADATNTVYHIATGLSDLALNLIAPAKKIWYYDVKIIDNNSETVANAYRFYVAYRPLYSFYDFVYVNSLGGLDSARATGDTDIQLEISFDDLEHISYKDTYNTRQPQQQFSSANIVKKDNYKGDVGFLYTKLQQESLIELLISEGIFQFIDDRWIRVQSLKKTHNLRNTADKKWSFPIEWTYAYNDTSFTPKSVNLGAGNAEDANSGPSTPYTILLVSITTNSDSELILNWTTSETYSAVTVEHSTDQVTWTPSTSSPTSPRNMGSGWTGTHYFRVIGIYPGSAGQTIPSNILSYP